MTCEEKVFKFIYKNYIKEMDKWKSGMKNQYIEWEKFLEEYQKFLKNNKNKKESNNDK